MSELERLARQLRQRIVLNQELGWAMPLAREVLRARPGGRETAGTEPMKAGRGVPGSRRPESSGVGAASGPTPPPGTASVVIERVPFAEPGASERPGPTKEAEDRRAALDRIREEVEACVRCPLSATRNRTVFGVGNPYARLLFVGEAPGFDEDRQGEPFVGKAGQLLDDIIKAMGLSRADVFIANVIKCRPPQNRVPNPGEVGACFPYLERQIEILRPEVMVALGGVAAKALLGVDLSMGKLRGRFHDCRGIPLMPTYHPAYLLRNPSEKRKVWEDVQLVMARLGLERR